MTASWMARLGYAGRGAIYLMVGGSAGLATVDPRHEPGGVTGSLRLFQHGWLGTAALILLAAGLACFAGWLTIHAVYRRDHPGRTHVVLVAGMLGDAAIYIGFMGSVLALAFGAHAGEDELQAWIGWLIGGGLGTLLLGAAGAVVCLCGIGLIAWGAVGDIEGPLELPSIDKKLMLPLGRYGTAGRGAAILLVGGYLILSAVQGNPHEAHELGGMLKEMRALPWGGAITGAFALAFVSSAALDLVAASFRRFNPRAP
ncbi:MAG: DUF1206 domain-containing protein [Alphaproteobacteria bacterium]|nr:DUF1206 domain-containing protein [Alphaproteobacteria bacterium]